MSYYRETDEGEAGIVEQNGVSLEKILEQYNRKVGYGLTVDELIKINYENNKEKVLKKDSLLKKGDIIFFGSEIWEAYGVEFIASGAALQLICEGGISIMVFSNKKRQFKSKYWIKTFFGSFGTVTDPTVGVSILPTYAKKKFPTGVPDEVVRDSWLGYFDSLNRSYGAEVKKILKTISIGMSVNFSDYKGGGWHGSSVGIGISVSAASKESKKKKSLSDYISLSRTKPFYSKYDEIYGMTNLQTGEKYFRKENNAVRYYLKEKEKYEKLGSSSRKDYLLKSNRELLFKNIARIRLLKERKKGKSTSIDEYKSKLNIEEIFNKAKKEEEFDNNKKLTEEYLDYYNNNYSLLEGYIESLRLKKKSLLKLLESKSIKKSPHGIILSKDISLIQNQIDKYQKYFNIYYPNLVSLDTLRFGRLLLSDSYKQMNIDFDEIEKNILKYHLYENNDYLNNIIRKAAYNSIKDSKLKNSIIQNYGVKSKDGRNKSDIILSKYISEKGKESFISGFFSNKRDEWNEELRQAEKIKEDEKKDDLENYNYKKAQETNLEVLKLLLGSRRMHLDKKERLEKQLEIIKEDRNIEDDSIIKIIKKEIIKLEEKIQSIDKEIDENNFFDLNINDIPYKHYKYYMGHKELYKKRVAINRNKINKYKKTPIPFLLRYQASRMIRMNSNLLKELKQEEKQSYFDLVQSVVFSKDTKFFLDAFKNEMKAVKKYNQTKKEIEENIKRRKKQAKYVRNLKKAIREGNINEKENYLNKERSKKLLKDEIALCKKELEELKFNKDIGTTDHSFLTKFDNVINSDYIADRVAFLENCIYVMTEAINTGVVDSDNINTLSVIGNPKLGPYIDHRLNSVLHKLKHYKSNTNKNEDENKKNKVKLQLLFNNKMKGIYLTDEEAEKIMDKMRENQFNALLNQYNNKMYQIREVLKFYWSNHNIDKNAVLLNEQTLFDNVDLFNMYYKKMKKHKNDFSVYRDPTLIYNEINSLKSILKNHKNNQNIHKKELSGFDWFVDRVDRMLFK